MPYLPASCGSRRNRHSGLGQYMIPRSVHRATFGRLPVEPPSTDVGVVVFQFFTIMSEALYALSNIVFSLQR